MRLAIKAHRDWKQVGLPRPASVCSNNHTSHTHDNPLRPTLPITRARSLLYSFILYQYLPHFQLILNRGPWSPARLRLIWREGGQLTRPWPESYEPSPHAPNISEVILLLGFYFNNCDIVHFIYLILLERREIMYKRGISGQSCTVLWEYTSVQKLSNAAMYYTIF